MTDHQPRRTTLRRPPRLRRGDRVALLTPSSPSNVERIDEGVDVLRFCGLEPVEYPSARARATAHPFLAGTDEERAKDVRAALLDDSIAGVLTVGGGYGSQRMLEVMDWTGLDAVEPKVVVGYSDVTGLLEALASRLGWASVMGPMVSEGEFRESYSFSSLWACLSAPDTYGPLRFPDAKSLVGGLAEEVFREGAGGQSEEQGERAHEQDRIEVGRAHRSRSSGRDDCVPRRRECASVVRIQRAVRPAARTRRAA